MDKLKTAAASLAVAIIALWAVGSSLRTARDAYAQSNQITTFQANQNILSQITANLVAALNFVGDVTATPSGNQITTTVARIQGNPVASGQPAAGAFYVENAGRTQLVPVTMSGPVTMSPTGVTTINGTSNGIFPVTAFNGVGDARSGGDGVTSGNATFTSATAAFTSADVGKTIVSYTGTGTCTVPDGTTISSITNSTTVQMSQSASGSGTGCDWYVGTNNLTPIVNTGKAACPSGLCGTSIVAFPPGRYLVNSTTSGSLLPMNVVSFGNTGGAVFGLRMIGAGGRANSQSSGINGASELILTGQAAVAGLDEFGGSSDELGYLDVEEAFGATGPKALMGCGKTTTSDGDVHLIHDSSLITRTTSSSTFALFAYGCENFTIYNTDIGALGGGDAIDWSGENSASITAPGQTLQTPPVSTTIFHIIDGASEIDTHGGNTSPATGILIDNGTANTVANLIFRNYFKCLGKEDNCIGDTGASSSEKYYDVNIDARFELNFAGSNTEQAINLGGDLNGASIRANVGENTASSNALIQAADAKMSEIKTIGPTAGTCVSVTSAAGSIIESNTGCARTITDSDALYSGTDAAKEGVTAPGYYGFNTIYSAAGTPIAACGAAFAHDGACVSDSTACTSGTTYTSGGATACHLHCDGTNWKEDGFGC